MYLKYGNKGSRSFIFTIEAVVTLILFGIFIISLNALAYDDLSDVMFYKQGSDLFEIILKDGSLEKNDIGHIELLLDALDLRARIMVDENIVLDQNPKNYVVIQRTLVTKDLQYIPVTLWVGK